MRVTRVGQVYDARNHFLGNPFRFRRVLAPKEYVHPLAFVNYVISQLKEEPVTIKFGINFADRGDGVRFYEKTAIAVNGRKIASFHDIEPKAYDSDDGSFNSRTYLESTELKHCMIAEAQKSGVRVADSGGLEFSLYH